LRIDRSSRERVLGIAGEPAAEGSGSFVSGDPSFESLGYSCRPEAEPDLMPVDGDYLNSYAYCRTVYFVNSETDRLAALFTSSPAFRGRGGIQPGMPTGEAERRAHRRAIAGCRTGFELGWKRGRAALLVEMEGGRIVNRSTKKGHVTPAVVGGRIGFFELESNHHPVGLEFC
jgi:hypothetical protein